MGAAPPSRRGGKVGLALLLVSGLKGAVALGAAPADLASLGFPSWGGAARDGRGVGATTPVVPPASFPELASGAGGRTEEEDPNGGAGADDGGLTGWWLGFLFLVGVARLAWACRTRAVGGDAALDLATAEVPPWRRREPGAFRGPALFGRSLRGSQVHRAGL